MYSIWFCVVLFLSICQTNPRRHMIFVRQRGQLCDVRACQSRLLASSLSSLRSPFTRLMWAKIFCPIMRSIIYTMPFD